MVVMERVAHASTLPSVTRTDRRRQSCRHSSCRQRCRQQSARDTRWRRRASDALCSDHCASSCPLIAPHIGLHLFPSIAGGGLAFAWCGKRRFSPKTTPLAIRRAPICFQSTIEFVIQLPQRLRARSSTVLRADERRVLCTRRANVASGGGRRTQCRASACVRIGK